MQFISIYWIKCKAPIKQWPKKDAHLAWQITFWFNTFAICSGFALASKAGSSRVQAGRKQTNKIKWYISSGNQTLQFKSSFLIALWAFNWAGKSCRGWIFHCHVCRILFLIPSNTSQWVFSDQLSVISYQLWRSDLSILPLIQHGVGMQILWQSPRKTANRWSPSMQRLPKGGQAWFAEKRSIIIKRI